MAQLKVAILGAGGKMGARVTANLRKKDYQLFFCERGPAVERLRALQVECSAPEQAVPASDLVVLAVPDVLIGQVSKEVVPLLRPGATLVLLDPAAAYARTVTMRDDCTFVVAHPCHPALYRRQDTLEAYEDYFGQTAARQDIVVALYAGKEADYPAAEQLCRDMFAPVERAFRITVDQMILLEPAAAEVGGGSVTYFLRDVIAELVQRGLPREAALSFMMGHVRTVLALTLGLIPGQVSDACKIAIEENYDKIFKEDWRKIFEPEVVRKTVEGMLHPKSR
jgi:D-apionate oxidoisomerase